MVLTRLVVCAAMAGTRLGELAWSRRNIRQAGLVAEGEWSRRTYPAIVAVHTAAIAGTFLFGRRTSWPWLALLVAVQPLRAWTLATLGRRWNTRGAVPDGLAVETGGPYRAIRHPNYAVVIVELAALPMAFGLRWLAVTAALVNAVLLGIRIRDEEEALRSAPGWEEHFARRKRFVPKVF